MVNSHIQIHILLFPFGLRRGILLLLNNKWNPARVSCILGNCSNPAPYNPQHRMQIPYLWGISIYTWQIRLDTFTTLFYQHAIISDRTTEIPQYTFRCISYWCLCLLIMLLVLHIFLFISSLSPSFFNFLFKSIS